MSGKNSLHYYMANLLRTMHTKFYQNRPGFMEDMTKHFGVFFRFTVYINLYVVRAFLMYK